MSQSSIPGIRLYGEGVIFKYLSLGLGSNGESQNIVRGLSSVGLQRDLDDRVLQYVKSELADSGWEADEDRLRIHGGGSLSLNSYYETITLFGASPRYGEESNREFVAGMVESEYPDYKIVWHSGSAREESDGKTE